ncbi:MAG: hypothetical protein WAP03_27935 [Methylorubrum rhodinum]|uniref:hypothetical protein n=1 Tax=Methylorubrum rhodinum TaxID=29428 RepID=UPI003BB032C3
MPAAVAIRKWEGTKGGPPTPPPMYSATDRYAIVALGVVASVVTLPLGILPTLLGGQLLVSSLTLQVGDRV